MDDDKLFIDRKTVFDIKVKPKIGIGIYKGWDVALSYLRGWGERERARLV
jgi:hypothetical protein